jgi:hypothetical protein
MIRQNSDVAEKILCVLCGRKEFVCFAYFRGQSLRSFAVNPHPWLFVEFVSNLPSINYLYFVKFFASVLL